MCYAVKSIICISSYRLLNRDEILEKKLVRPECGESAVCAPEPEYSRDALFRGLVCPATRLPTNMAVHS